jgi:hypothetical protein
MADVRILKFDVGSSTDQMLNNVQRRLDASTGVEAFRRGLAIADTVTSLLKDEGAKGRKLYIENADGTRQEIILAG